MKKPISLQNIFSAHGSTTVFISKEVDEYMRLVLKDIHSGRDTHVELNKFYDAFDIYQDVQRRKKKLQQLTATTKSDARYRKLTAQIQEIVAIEKQMRKDILELALSLERARDTKKMTQLRNQLKKGRLKHMQQTLQEVVLLVQQEKYVLLGEQINDVADRLVDNSNEFSIKAQLTNMNYLLPDRFTKAISFFDKGLLSAEISGRKEHLAEYCLDHARFMFDHGEYARAKRSYITALSVYNSNEHKYHVEICTLWNHMGALHRVTNAIEDAETAYGKALAFYKKCKYNDTAIIRSGMAMTLNNLGILQGDQKAFFSASRSFNRSLTILENLSKKHPHVYEDDIALVWNNLGNIYADQNRYQNALDAYNNALVVRKKLARYNADVYLPQVAMTQNNLGVLQMEYYQFGGAYRSFTSALKLYSDMAARDPEAYLPDVALTLHNMGSLWSHKNDLKKAELSFSEAAGIYRTLAGSNPQAWSPLLARTLNSMGTISVTCHRDEAALAAYNEALNIIRRFADMAPDIYMQDMGMVLNNLGDLMREMGNEEAGVYYMQALAIRKKLATKNEPNTFSDLAVTLNNIAVFHHENNDHKEANKFHRMAFGIRKRMTHVASGIYAPGLAETLNNWAGTLMAQGNNKKARELYTNALELFTALSKENRTAFLPDVAMTVNNLGVLNAATGRYAEADLLYKKARSIYRKAAKTEQDMNTPDVIMTLVNLAELYQKNIPDKRRSLAYIQEALRLIHFSKRSPVIHEYEELLYQFLKKWDITPEHFAKAQGLTLPRSAR